MDTVVVNDGSDDRTKKVAEEYGAILLEHPSNLGKGAALRTGFNYMVEKGYQVVITLDADGQHNPADIPALLNIFRKVKPDLLIASRAGEFGRMTFPRRFWNRLAARAVARLCHADITDSQSGFRLIRAEILKEIPVVSSGYEMELELLIKACQKGFDVLSIPTTPTKPDGTAFSHFKPVSDTWKGCKVFLRILFGLGD
jgi:glycosyltransferase involved in cell wall biosynthesis